MTQQNKSDGGRTNLGSETASVDFSILYGGSISLFVPLTQAARDWLAEYCPADGEHSYLGPNLAVEARYLGELIQYAMNDGLAFAQSQNYDNPDYRQIMNLNVVKRTVLSGLVSTCLESDEDIPTS